jgi:hypothetical protein
LLEGDLGGVVEEIGSADFAVFGVFDDGGFKAVEREAVGYFFGCGVLFDVSYASK